MCRKKYYEDSPVSPLSAQRRRGLSGFSLIELMVTVAVIAVLAAMAMPSMNRMIARHRLMTAADEMMTLVRYAQSEARLRGKAGVVTLSSAAGGDGEYNLSVNVSEEVVRNIRLHPRLKVTLSPSLDDKRIFFFPNGHMRPSDKQGPIANNPSEIRGMLLLCSLALPAADAPNFNAIALRFSGAEVRLQKRDGGEGCSIAPPNFD